MEDFMRELKDMRIWVCWRYEEKDGRKTKVPKSASGSSTGSDDKWSSSWVTYDEAVAGCEANGYNGVSFKVPEGYYFIDIDHVSPDDPLAQTVIARHDTYTEYSVSGNGIHLYGKCDPNELPCSPDGKDGAMKLDRDFYTKNPKNGMELYIGGLSNRFAAYTGNVINAAPLREGTQAVLTTLDKNMRKKQPVKYSAERDGDKVDFDMICRLRKQKNGEKFSKLYDQGDFSDYGSQSEADAALCAMLAFRTGPDPDAIDHLFRNSALYREKWERRDYREATIQMGIEACHGTFHKSTREAPPFVYYDKKCDQVKVSVPLLARYAREHLRYILVRDNGKQGLLVFVYESGCYRLYSNDMLEGILKSYIAAYDETLIKMGQVREALQNLLTDLNYVGQDDLNADEHIINFRNGLLYVDANELRFMPHSPEVFSTIQIPCDWTGHSAPTPVFDRYMRTLTDGDSEKERLLLEFNGAVISNIKGWRTKKSLFLVGKGDTGKSVLKSLTERLLGRDNFIGIDLKEIEARFGTGTIYGTRLAGSSDMSFMSVDELKTFKKLTGGDSVFAEFKGQQGFQFTYNGMLWFCMNRLPKFGGDDGQWVYDRIMVVDCPNVIPKDAQDKLLLDKLYAERDGIVYRYVKALQTVMANGYRFSEPESVTAARQQYRDSNSTVISFFEECMCELPNGKINPHCTTGVIYKVYTAWCSDNNRGYAKTAREFRDDLAEHLNATFAEISTRRNGCTYYKDYTLTLETKQQYAREYGYDSADFLE